MRGKTNLIPDAGLKTGKFKSYTDNNYENQKQDNDFNNKTEMKKIKYSERISNNQQHNKYH